MWFLLVIGLDVASIGFVGATARAGRSILPGLHVTLALVMVVMALFGGIPRGRELIPIVLILAAAAVLIRRGRCSQPTCWHLIGCAVGMGLLALDMPTATSMQGMAGMSPAAMRLDGVGAIIGAIVLGAFFLVSAFQAAVLIERRALGGGRASSLTLERLALLTGSLAMVAMAAGMLAGAAAPITA